MIKTIAIIGAGVSGVAAAKKLSAVGFDVSIFDQGKTAGGRLGLRTLKGPLYENRNIDVGAAYFTAQIDEFINQKDQWINQGLVLQWTDTFQVYENSEFTIKSGPMRYVAKGGLKNLVLNELEAMKTKIKIYQDKKVESIKILSNKVLVNSQEFDAVVLATPAIQAIKLFEDTKIKKSLETVKFNPVLVAWLAAKEIMDFSGIFVNSHNNISLIINEGNKQKDNSSILTVYSTHEFAAREISDLDLAKEKLINSAQEIFNVNFDILESGIMRWTYAQPVSAERPYLAKNIAIVGDAYSENPRIEAAWMDGSEVLGQLSAIL
jgi:predicted NAD/FAD-dependent oxidoreductase